MSLIGHFTTVAFGFVILFCVYALRWIIWPRNIPASRWWFLFWRRFERFVDRLFCEPLIADYLHKIGILYTLISLLIVISLWFDRLLQ